MRNDRLFEIIYILLGRGHVTAKELAQRFGVSVRTIYRDIDTLSGSGVPVYATQGTGGGIHLLPSYVLNKSTLTDTEQSEILFALKSLSIVDDPHEGELLMRLGNLFGKKIEEWIEIDFSHWGQRQRERNALALLKRAILDSRMVAFRYYGANGSETRRTAYPVKLQYKANAWYMQGYDPDKNAYRTFKLFRIADLCMSEQFFQKERLPPVPEIDQAWGSDVQVISATLWFAQHAIWRIWEHFNVIDIQRNADGSCVVETSLVDDVWLTASLLSYGTALKVLKPASLRQRLLAEIEKIICLYQQT